MAASLDDMLTAVKNSVTAINNLSQTWLQINGQSIASNVSSAALVKTGAGRLCSVSVVTPGSTEGKIYDTNSISSTSGVIYSVLHTVAIGTIQVVNLPFSNGLVIVPGTGQVLAVSYT
jgi:hypothetical protein